MRTWRRCADAINTVLGGQEDEPLVFIERSQVYRGNESVEKEKMEEEDVVREHMRLFMEVFDVHRMADSKAMLTNGGAALRYTFAGDEKASAVEVLGVPAYDSVLYVRHEDGRTAMTGTRSEELVKLMGGAGLR